VLSSVINPWTSWSALSSLLFCLHIVGCSTALQSDQQATQYTPESELVIDRSTPDGVEEFDYTGYLGPEFSIPSPLSALPLGSDQDPALEGVPSIWSVYRKNTILNLQQDNPRIKVQRDWYAKNQSYLDRVTVRAEPYLYYILEQSIKRGIPSELALLPAVESAFDPFAYSHGRAAGIWQFIPGTGRAYGLHQTWWYEGRRDIVAATDAAMNYLQALNKQFDGDWMLALASYNSGGGTVRKAMRKNKAQGKPTDFWALDLPKETREYVPKLIAIAQIFKSPKRYGVTLIDYAYQPFFEEVDIGAQLDLALAAKMAGISIEELYRLNPGFNKWATDPEGPHHLLVPVDNAQQMRDALVKLPPEKRVEWDRYTIKRGDSILSISKAHHITPALLKQINQLSSNTIRAGKTLLIPQSSQPLTSYSLSQDQRLNEKLNRTISGKRKLTYRVGKGDSFWTISRRYGVNTQSLAKWNGMAPGDTLVAGRKLVIWQETKVSADKMSEQRQRKIHYRARSGDSYARIANRFNISLRELKRWNQVDFKKYLQPGDMLTLYIDVANAP